MKQSHQNFYYNPDCRYFRGDVPCVFWRPCMDCPHYEPIRKRVLIIFLRRLGDILIASPLPRRIKAEYGEGTHITWLANQAEHALVKMNPYVDRALVFDWQSSAQLQLEKFDLVVCFERTPSAAALVERIEAEKKVGLSYGGKHNTLYPLNEEAEYFFKMNTWNHFRTQINQKTWTEIFFGVLGYEYRHESYELQISNEHLVQASQVLHSNNFADKDFLCLNVGSSSHLKTWSPNNWSRVAEKILDKGKKIMIAGGRNEQATIRQIKNDLPEVYHDRIFSPDYDYPLELFCAYIHYATAMITGDTFGFHVALATNTPVIVMFGPSNPMEIVPKQAHRVVVLQSKWECVPCARQPVFCKGEGGCMSDISTEACIDALEKLL